MDETGYTIGFIYSADAKELAKVHQSLDKEPKLISDIYHISGGANLARLRPKLIQG